MVIKLEGMTLMAALVVFTLLLAMAVSAPLAGTSSRALVRVRRR
ncbi:hypothetical protein [Nocardia uniformis]|nr:hypothetical protein [Nocardia uniformis]